MVDPTSNYSNTTNQRQTNAAENQNNLHFSKYQTSTNTTSNTKTTTFTTTNNNNATSAPNKTNLQPQNTPMTLKKSSTPNIQVTKADSENFDDFDSVTSSEIDSASTLSDLKLNKIGQKQETKNPINKTNNNYATISAIDNRTNRQLNSNSSSSIFATNMMNKASSHYDVQQKISPTTTSATAAAASTSQLQQSSPPQSQAQPTSEKVALNKRMSNSLTRLMRRSSKAKMNAAEPDEELMQMDVSF